MKKRINGFFSLVLGSIFCYSLVWYTVPFRKPDLHVGKRALHDGTVCPYQLGPSGRDNIKKIKAYTFPNTTETYIKHLFRGDRNTTPPQYPAFVTGFSSAYFLKGMCLTRHVSRLRSRYRDIKMYVFDLGLTHSERKELLQNCDCEVRDFPFHLFPPHVKTLKGYAFKPLAIQLIAKEHPFVVWADASVRFLTDDIDNFLERARRQGVMAGRALGSVAMRTLRETFSFLGEEPCVFRDLDEIEATFISLYETGFIQDYFMRPWVKCALTEGCMTRAHWVKYHHNCITLDPPVYHECHRFDQSILSILMYRLFGESVEDHKINHTFFTFCRGATERWWAPRIYNKLRLRYVSACNAQLNCLDDF